MDQATERRCGDCSLCCKLMGIDALAKPRGVRCHHFARGSGCTIYAERPAECRSFACPAIALCNFDAELPAQAVRNFSRFLVA